MYSTPETHNYTWAILVLDRRLTDVSFIQLSPMTVFGHA